AWTTVGLWGPRARDVLQPVTLGDLSHAGFGFATCRDVEIGGVTVLASRISYVGELGWELYVPMEQGAAVGDTGWGARQAPWLGPVGIGVYGTTGRLEKGYRAFGNELTPDYNLVEAGMTRPRVKEQPFIGKEAYLAQRETPPAAVLCTLTVDDHASADGQLRYMLGGEPILSAEGERLADAAGRPPLLGDRGGRGPVGGQAPAEALPAAAARARRCPPGRRVLRRAVSGDGRGGRVHPAVRPGEHAGPELSGMEIGVCVKRVPMVGG